MKDLVMTINSVQKSSKSELSSRGKRPFKVFSFFLIYSATGGTKTNSSKNTQGSASRAPETAVIGKSRSYKASTTTLLINWSTSELNRQLNPTSCLGDTDCWIQQVTAPTLVVTCWIQQPACILPSTCTGGRRPPCPTRR